ncbi:hypothetical protein SCAB_52442 [Streptomyces scabiei 87.22]|uniref:Uncharacterized protein n=1 Tax=Streptomyces scabiei (strain 87.22) TaxID=680198 RepID=C9YV84_STRSW|nr:hypothetical protein SCAB_52442 [Streptomyces scabiei 87.22]
MRTAGIGSSDSAATEIAEWAKDNGSAVSDYSGLYRLDASDVG